MLNQSNSNKIFELINRIKNQYDVERIRITNDSHEAIGYLKPLTIQDQNNSSLISDFVEWRNRDRSGWLDQRVVNFDGTTKWLGNLLNNDSRIAFLIYDNEMNLIGRIGVLDITDTEAMTDSILRGRADLAPGIITHACFAMFRWLFNHSCIENIKSKIVEGNDASLKLHHRLGFEIHSRKVLNIQDTELGPVLIERSNLCNSSNEQIFPACLLIMNISRSRFFSNPRMP